MISELQTPARPSSRRSVPRVCVADYKPHIRTFLADMFEERGFVTHQCERLANLYAALPAVAPNVVVLGRLASERGPDQALRTLAAENFAGKVMLFGGRSSETLAASQHLGEKLHLAMLPPLATPFHERDLDENLADFLPVRPARDLAIDLDEALRRDWLELWYQPKIDPHALALRGAEALLRIRHPALGIVPVNEPGYSSVLADFVVTRALADWREFASEAAPLELALHLPLAAFEDAPFIEGLRARLYGHPAFTSLVVEIAGADLIGDPWLAQTAAKLITPHKIGLSIGDVAAQAQAFASLEDFPVAEIKLQWKQVGADIADLERAACAPILDIAQRYGARTVADGIDTHADFEAARRLGFDLVQGGLFAKPMEARKFARSIRARGIVSG